MINRAAVLGALLVAVSLVVGYSPAFAIPPVENCGVCEVITAFDDPLIATSVAGCCMLTSYYDLATSVMPSGAGYGGLGQSGGAGDALVRIVNPNHYDTLHVTTGVRFDGPDGILENDQNGTLCGMIYVFDDNEEMQECCGCPVTPDGMRTLSTVNDLTSNLAVNGGDRAAGVIDILAATLDWVAPFAGAPPPRGVNVAGSSGLGCDPSFGFGSATSESSFLPSALRAWTNHTESMAGVSAPFKGVVSTSTDEFASAHVDGAHLVDLVESCGFLLSNDSGRGVCSCGVGDNQSAFRPHR